MSWQSGHIPGALFLHMDRDLSATKTGQNGRHPLPDPSTFASRVQQLGVNQHTQVVVYDAQGGMMAARLWWMLRWIGHQAVSVLDGGFPAWQTDMGKIETTPPSPREPGTLKARPTLTTTVSVQDVMGNLKTQTKLVIDARSPERFRGENETLDPVGGHIPGAHNRFFQNNLGPDGCFKKSDQLRSEFEALLKGVSPSQVIAQCGSGVAACHNLLALEIADLSGAALYPGSWSEWCSDPSRPVSTAE